MSYGNPTLVVRDEDTDTHCGFDFETFAIGFDCPDLATKVLIDTSDDNFHWAHLCPPHAEKVMASDNG